MSTAEAEIALPWLVAQSRWHVMGNVARDGRVLYAAG